MINHLKTELKAAGLILRFLAETCLTVAAVYFLIVLAWAVAG